MTNENGKLEDITIISKNSRDECSENKKLLQINTSIIADGFGVADCKNDCGAHLIYLGA